MIVLILLAPILYAASMYGVAFLQGSLKMQKLNENAQVLERELGSLTFVDGVSVPARGVVEGDTLTAQSNTAASTFAKGSLSVNRSFESIESEIEKNLATSGFKKEKAGESTAYRTSPTSPRHDSIVLRYTKNDTAVRVVYQFTQTHSCPKNYICEHTRYIKSNKDPLPLSAFGQYEVSRFDVTYAATSNEFHSGFRF